MLCYVPAVMRKSDIRTILKIKFRPSFAVQDGIVQHLLQSMKPVEFYFF